MKSQATSTNEGTQKGVVKSYLGQSYHKVVDGRKQPIRGLWSRNGQFYARLRVEDEHGRRRTIRKRLEGAQTVAQAQKALSTLQGQRDSNSLPTLKRTPYSSSRSS